MVIKGYSYTSTRPIGRTACTEPRCLYEGVLYLTFTCHFVCWIFYCSFCLKELCPMVLRSYLVNLLVSLYQTLIAEKILIMYTVGIGWVLHALRSCYPLNFTETPIGLLTLSNCRSYVVMKLTHFFAAAETCDKVQRHPNRVAVPSSPPIATFEATLLFFHRRFSEFVDMCNFNITNFFIFY
jgi:hypothetical protein